MDNSPSPLRGQPHLKGDGPKGQGGVTELPKPAQSPQRNERETRCKRKGRKQPQPRNDRQRMIVVQAESLTKRLETVRQMAEKRRHRADVDQRPQGMPEILRHHEKDIRPSRAIQRMGSFRPEQAQREVRKVEDNEGQQRQATPDHGLRGEGRGAPVPDRIFFRTGTAVLQREPDTKAHVRRKQHSQAQPGNPDQRS